MKKLKPQREKEKPFNETFFNDLIMLRGFPLEKQIELVDKILEWVPEDRDTTWKKWTKDVSNDKKVTSAINVLLFIVQEGIKKNFTDEDFINDLKAFKLSNEFINYFIKKLNEKKEKIIYKITKSSYCQTEQNYWIIGEKKIFSLKNVVINYTSKNRFKKRIKP